MNLTGLHLEPMSKINREIPYNKYIFLYVSFWCHLHDVILLQYFFLFFFLPVCRIQEYHHFAVNHFFFFKHLMFLLICRFVFTLSGSWVVLFLFVFCFASQVDCKCIKKKSLPCHPAKYILYLFKQMYMDLMTTVHCHSTNELHRWQKCQSIDLSI